MKKTIIVILSLWACCSHAYGLTGLYYFNGGNGKVYYGKMDEALDSRTISFDKLTEVKIPKCYGAEPAERVSCIVNAYLKTDKANRQNYRSVIIDHKIYYYNPRIAFIYLKDEN